MTRLRTRVVTMTIVAGLTVAVRAGQSGPQQPPQFRASVDIVQVDVSVVDRDKHPVTGLDAADFTLLENGRPQEVVAFAEVRVPAAPALPAAWLRNVPPDVRSNNLGDGRLFAIVMDDATMPPDLRITANARQIGRDIVMRLGPDDLAAIIFVNDGRRSVDFTNDRARLLAAVDAFTPGFAYADPDPRTDSQHYFASIRTLGLVSARLAHVPQRRKAVVYVSTGIPVELVTNTFVATPTALRVGQSATVDVLDTTMDETIDTDLLVAVSELLEHRPQEAYGAALREALVRAQYGNVNIYSIDPAGLGGLEGYLQSRVRVGASGTALVTPIEAVMESHLHRDFLRSVAETSGGRAILNTNNFDAGVTSIFEANSAYYLIGYQSTRDPADLGVRQVTVRMNRGGLSAHTRNAYLSTRDARAPATPATDVGPALVATLAGVLPNPALTLRAASAAFALPGGRASLAVTLGVEQHVLGDVGDRVNEELSVLAAAFSPDGQARAWFRQNLRVTLRAGLNDPAAYEVLSRIDLDPGRYQVRLAAHSAMTGKTGSVYFDVVVPAFGREALQLSGVTLSARPSLAVAPGDGVAALLPVLPTSRRRFSPADIVSGFLRVYQNGAGTPAPVAMALTITDGKDRVVHHTADLIGAERFSGGQADYEWSLPVSNMLSGEYLLTVSAAQNGKAIRRDVRFTVR